MFDEVTKLERGRNAARRFGYVAGSTAFQILLVLAVVSASAAIKAKVVAEEVVEVKFVRPSAPPPPPPPPAPPARRPPQDKAKSDAPKPPPPPPQALLQPKDVQEEMKVDPNEPPEPEYDYEGGSDDGVVGGVVGAQTIEEAPAYAAAGYVRPRESEKGCVKQNVRIPRDLQGFVSGTVSFKFAVRADGSVSQFGPAASGQQLPDRILAAVYQAVRTCTWVPGTDPRGTPTSIWVILPLKFEGG